MKAWILYRKEDAIKNKGYIDCYIEEGKKRNIEFLLVLVEDLTFGVKNGEAILRINNQKAERPDFAVIRTIYPFLSECLEEMGIKIYNKSDVAFLCNNKARTYQWVTSLAIPTIPTEFYEGELLLSKLKDGRVDENDVIKSVDGHGGAEVFLASEWKERELIFANRQFVLQKMLDGPGEDVRVYCIGKRIVAAIKRRAVSGFKANFSLGGDVCEYQLSEKEKALVHKILKAKDFSLIGIDFIINEKGEFIFNEIEDVVGARMLYQCTDINIVSEYLDYILSVQHLIKR